MTLFLFLYNLPSEGPSRARTAAGALVPPTPWQYPLEIELNSFDFSEAPPMLRLTKITDYGILLVTALTAGRTGTVSSARGLSEITGVPLPTVSKVLKALVHAGILHSSRGVGGGFSLARPAAQISVAQIVTALEGPIAITECLGENPAICGLEATCRVRGNWERINLAVRGALDGLSVAEMASTPPPEWASGANRTQAAAPSAGGKSTSGAAATPPTRASSTAPRNGSVAP